MPLPAKPEGVFCFLNLCNAKETFNRTRLSQPEPKKRGVILLGFMGGEGQRSPIHVLWGSKPFNPQHIHYPIPQKTVGMSALLQKLG
jgi:hypothetical protein